MFNEIKWAYQRVVKGYDDRIYWGFDSVIYNIQEPLKKFCLNYLEDKKHSRLNPERTAVFKQTLFLIEQIENEEYQDMFNNKALGNLAKYFGENIGWYWD